MSADKVFSADEKKKLTDIINEGMSILHECDTLQEGLNETIKAIAEELEIKPATLKKAIKVAHKARFTQESENHAELENILTTVGRTL